MQDEKLPPPGAIISPDTLRDNRIPPGQSLTVKWPVLDAFGPPRLNPADWKLVIGGLVRHPLAFTWEEFNALPKVKVFSDFHCVTRWSRLDNTWEGVSVKELIERAGGIKPEARYVVAHGYDGGWTTWQIGAGATWPGAAGGRLFTVNDDGIDASYAGVPPGAPYQQLWWFSAWAPATPFYGLVPYEYVQLW